MILRITFGVLLVNGGAVEGYHVLGVEGAGGAAGQDHDAAFVEFDCDASCDAFLGLVDEGVQVMVEGLVDKTGVCKLGPLLVNHFLELELGAA